MSYVPPASITFITGELIGSDELKRILDISPECHIIYRPYFAPSDNVLDYQNYINAVCSMIDENNESFWGFVPEAQRHLQMWNEPNMPRWSQWEGFGDSVDDMLRFNDWFCKAYAELKTANPTFKIGFTPLTPGNRDVFFPDSPDPENVPYYMHGPEAARPSPSPDDIQAAIRSGPCYEALTLADEYYAHIYVINDAEHQIYERCYGLRFLEYDRFFPKPMNIWIPENGIGGPAYNWVRWYDLLNKYPDVKGTSIWRLEWEVRDPDSDMVQTLKRYVESWLPPEPPPEPDDLELALRHRAWNERDIAYNPDAAFAAYATGYNLGGPLTNEVDLETGGLTYRLQGYVGGIVYAEVGKWDQTTHIAWHGV